MFSATFPVGVQKAAAEFLKPNYVYIVIGIVGGACTDVEQVFYQVERAEKRTKLMEFLRNSPPDEKVLVFCNSKKGADFLATSLASQNISTTSIHGDRLQSQREQALREFTTSKKKVLVATAVAARGLGKANLLFSEEIRKTFIVLVINQPTPCSQTFPKLVLSSTMTFPLKLRNMSIELVVPVGLVTLARPSASLRRAKTTILSHNWCPFSKELDRKCRPSSQHLVVDTLGPPTVLRQQITVKG